jgi:hypothetical protein
VICCDARVLTRSLSAGLAACILLLAPGAAAARADTQPPECKPGTVADSTKNAMAVFTGEVTGSTREDRPAGQQGAYFPHDVTVTRVYQGEVDSDAAVVRTETGPARECGLGRLSTGTEYMFFVDGSGDPWVATGTGGTAPVTAELVAKVERLLGEGTDPVPAEPEPAEFFPVEVDAPQTLSRAVAPGLALVLIGLLGLVLVRWLASRPR